MRTVKMKRWFGFFVVQGNSIVQPRFSSASLRRSLIPDKGRNADSVGKRKRLGPEDSSGGLFDFLFLPINAASPYFHAVNLLCKLAVTSVEFYKG